MHYKSELFVRFLVVLFHFFCGCLFCGVFFCCFFYSKKGLESRESFGRWGKALFDLDGNCAWRGELQRLQEEAKEGEWSLGSCSSCRESTEQIREQKGRESKGVVGRVFQGPEATVESSLNCLKLRKKGTLQIMQQKKTNHFYFYSFWEHSMKLSLRESKPWPTTC